MSNITWMKNLMVLTNKNSQQIDVKLKVKNKTKNQIRILDQPDPPTVWTKDEV